MFILAAIKFKYVNYRQWWKRVGRTPTNSIHVSLVLTVLNWTTNLNNSVNKGTSAYHLLHVNKSLYLIQQRATEHFTLLNTSVYQFLVAPVEGVLRAQERRLSVQRGAGQSRGHCMQHIRCAKLVFEAVLKFKRAVGYVIKSVFLGCYLKARATTLQSILQYNFRSLLILNITNFDHYYFILFHYGKYYTKLHFI